MGLDRRRGARILEDMKRSALPAARTFGPSPLGPHLRHVARAGRRWLAPRVVPLAVAVLGTLAIYAALARQSSVAHDLGPAGARTMADVAAQRFVGPR